MGTRTRVNKVEPVAVPIWVSVFNVPHELWYGGGIGKLMSGIGKPLLMDKVTKERCVSKSGRAGYARVLVEASADKELPMFIEVEYPSKGMQLGRIVKLDVGYQWKPSMCAHCKVFGHNHVNCENRPRTEEEIAAMIVKDAINMKSDVDGIKKQGDVDSEGYTVVNRRNKNSNATNQAGYYRQVEHNVNQPIKSNGKHNSQYQGAKEAVNNRFQGGIRSNGKGSQGNSQRTSHTGIWNNYKKDQGVLHLGKKQLKVNFVPVMKSSEIGQQLGKSSNKDGIDNTVNGDCADDLTAKSALVNDVIKSYDGIMSENAFETFLNMSYKLEAFGHANK